MVLTIIDSKRKNEKFKDNYKVDHQDNESNNSSIDSYDPRKVLPPIIGVSNTKENGKNKYRQGDINQSNKNKTGGKLTYNDNDLKKVNHYLDPDNPDLESGVDNGMIIWSYKLDISTNMCTIPPLENVNIENNMNHKPMQKLETELDKEQGEGKCDDVQLGTTGHTTESKGHVDGKYYLITNDTNYIEQHFNLMESGVSKDDIVWYSNHTKISESRSYLHAARENIGNVIDNNNFLFNASYLDVKEGMRNPTHT